MQGTMLTAPSAESADESVLPALTRSQRIQRSALIRSLLLQPVHLFGVVLAAAAVGLALFGPALAPHSPTVPDYTAAAARILDTAAKAGAQYADKPQKGDPGKRRQIQRESDCC